MTDPCMHWEAHNLVCNECGEAFDNAEDLRDKRAQVAQDAGAALVPNNDPPAYPPRESYTIGPYGVRYETGAGCSGREAEAGPARVHESSPPR